MPSTVFAVIPVFNRLAFTISCLSCLQRQTYAPIRIIVVDGGSTDGTVETLRRDWPDVLVVSGLGDLWWGGAMRAGIERALAESRHEDDLILMMNNDTLVDPDFVATLVCVSRDTGAAVGAVIVDSRDPSRVLDAGEFIRWQTYEFPVKSTIEPGETGRDDVDVLPGRGSVIPLRMVRAAGNVDAAAFPHYLADYEFFARLRAHGFALRVTYETKIRAHIDETGLAPTQQTLPLREFWTLLTSRKSMLNVRDHWHFIQRHAPTAMRARLKRVLIGRCLSLLCFRTGVKYIMLPIRKVYLVLYWWMCSTYYVTERDCARFGLKPERLVADGVLAPWRAPGWYVFARAPRDWWRDRPECRPLYWRDWNPLTKPRRWVAALQASQAGRDSTIEATSSESSSLLPQAQSRTGKGPVRLGLVLLDNPGWIGGGIYLSNLVDTLACLPKEEQPIIRLLGWSDPDSPLVRRLRSYGCVEPLSRERTPASSVYGQVIERLAGKWHRLIDGANPDRAASIDAIYPAGFSPMIDRVEAAKLYWITDFQHAALPELFSREELEIRQRGMAEIAGRNAVLVLSSRAALRDFQRLFPGAAIRPRVWSFCSPLRAVNGSVDPITRYRLPRKFLYLPNQFWVHKDHLTVFKALRLLKSKGMQVPMVCTGLENDPRQPRHMERLREFVSAADLESQVRFLGMVPREHQVEIFRHAAAVVQPSLFEGWSTVVEDAKALGRPILLSDLAVHQEQVEDERASFFQAGSAEALASALERVWPELVPGPDPEREGAAQARLARRQVDSARQFMALVREAMALSGTQATTCRPAA